MDTKNSLPSSHQPDDSRSPSEMMERVATNSCIYEINNKLKYKHYMKHISNAIKKCIAAIATIILLLFISYFFIKQPLFIAYKFSDSSIPSELYLTNQEKLKEHVKFLSTNNRTSEEGQKIVVDYILADLKKNGIHEENIVTQSYIIDGREYKNIIVSFGLGHIPKEQYRNKKIIIG